MFDLVQSATGVILLQALCEIPIGSSICYCGSVCKHDAALDKIMRGHDDFLVTTECNASIHVDASPIARSVYALVSNPWLHHRDEGSWKHMGLACLLKNDACPNFVQKYDADLSQIYFHSTKRIEKGDILTADCMRFTLDMTLHNAHFACVRYSWS